MAYAAVIFLASSVPHPPDFSAAASDKTLHALLYGGFAIVWLRALAAGAWARVTPWLAVVAALGATLYGATDEFHQRFVLGRTADLLDLAADGVGALAAVSLALALGWLRERRAAGSPW